MSYSRPVPGALLAALTQGRGAGAVAAAVPPRVLVVDDDARVRATYVAMLEQAGFDVDAAADGNAAMRLLLQRRHAVALVDLLMPDPDGLAVLEHVRSECIDTACVVVSGDGRVERVKEAMRRGAVDFVVKPCPPHEFADTVRRALDARAAERARTHLVQQLEQSDVLHRFIVHSSPDLVYMLDRDGRFVFLNERFATLLGHDRERLRGRHFSEIVADEDMPTARFVLHERRTGARAARHALLRLQAGSPRGGNLDSALLSVEVSATGIYFDDQQTPEAFLGSLGMARDVTERRRAQAMLDFQAYHDLLTRLPNRALFRDRLTLAIAHARRSKSRLAVMFADLNRFKSVNDTHGHTMGDRLLNAVADRLKGVLRQGDTLARFGGDEFTLLLPQVRTQADVETIANKLLEALTTPFAVDGHELRIGGCIGIAVYPEAGGTTDDLVRNADIAMYATKAQGGDGYQFFTEEMRQRFSTRLDLQRELAHAIDAGELEVHYLPGVGLDDGRIESLEALLRWRHPRRGLLAPGDFLSAAEEAGLVPRLDAWLAARAFDDIALWRRHGHADVRLSINLSAQQMAHGGFAEQLLALMQAHGVEPAALNVDVAESIMTHAADGVAAQLQTLRGHGVTVTIDDFGSGLSSLSHLRRFPSDALKIDRSCIQNIRDEADDPAVLAAIAAVARRLGLDLVAEGVESEAQLQHLRREGLHHAQGFLFSRPCDHAHTAALLSGAGFAELLRGR